MLARVFLVSFLILIFLDILSHGQFISFSIFLLFCFEVLFIRLGSYYCCHSSFFAAVGNFPLLFGARLMRDTSTVSKFVLETDVSIKVKVSRFSEDIKIIVAYSGDLRLEAFSRRRVDFVGVTSVQPFYSILFCCNNDYITEYNFIETPGSYVSRDPFVIISSVSCKYCQATVSPVCIFMYVLPNSCTISKGLNDQILFLFHISSL